MRTPGLPFVPQPLLRGEGLAKAVGTPRHSRGYPRKGTGDPLYELDIFIDEERLIDSFAASAVQSDYLLRAEFAQAKSRSSQLKDRMRAVSDEMVITDPPSLIAAAA